MRWPLPWPKSWREGTPQEEAEEEGEGERKSLRESAILFARDLAVAFLVVALVLGALWAYTGVWPPMVVVESGSMQHSNVDSYIGVIDTGDLVLTQAINSPADVVTYVQGRVSGYETYGNYGDVIVFHSPTDPSNAATPIIHRAMVYVEPDSSGLGFDAPSLTALPAGDWNGVLWNDSAATTPYHLRSVTLLNVRAWNGGVFGLEGLTFNQVPGMVAGFLTHGDHNPAYFDPHGAVSVSRIIGKARGELPWFGLLKLTLSPGSSGCCPRGWGDQSAPKNSWDALLVSLVAIIVLPFVADFAWGFYTDRRKRRRKEARLAAKASAGDGREPPESSEPPVVQEPSEGEPPPESEPPEIEETPEPTGEPPDEPRTESSEPGDGGPEGP